MKKKKEQKLKEKTKFKKKNTIINIPRKIAPVKKKIIGASVIIIIFIMYLFNFIY